MQVDWCSNWRVFFHKVSHNVDFNLQAGIKGSVAFTGTWKHCRGVKPPKSSGRIFNIGHFPLPGRSWDFVGCHLRPADALQQAGAVSFTGDRLCHADRVPLLKKTIPLTSTPNTSANFWPIFSDTDQSRERRVPAMCDRIEVFPFSPNHTVYFNCFPVMI